MTRLSLGFILTAALLLVALNLWLPSYINSYRPSLEAFISSKIHAPVSIGELQAHREGILPRIEIADVRIINPDGSNGLTISHMRASLSVSSLFLFKVQFAELNIEHANVAIELREGNALRVAGIDLQNFAKNTGTPTTTAKNLEVPAAVLWLIRQPNINFQGGVIQWSDQRGRTPSVRLENINASLRSSGYTHLINVEATPPPDLAAPITIQASLTEPILNTATQPQNWGMDLRTTLPQVHIESLIDLFSLSMKDIESIQGTASIDSHIQFSNQELHNSELKLIIPELAITTSTNLPRTELKDFNSTLQARWRDKTLSLEIDDLSFQHNRTSQDHEIEKIWANKRIELNLQFDDARQLAGGSFKIADFDLATLSSIAQGLPLPENARQTLSEMNAQGTINALSAEWKGSFSELKAYSIQGEVSDFMAAAGEAPPIPEGKKIAVGRPGIEHLNVRFNISEQTGEIHLNIENGAVYLPGVYDIPNVPITRLETSAYIERLESGQFKINASNIDLASPDLELNAQLSWLSPDPNDEADKAGYLTMSGKLVNGQVAAVPRYLPNSIQPKVRTYLKAALISGDIPEATVTINGPLGDFPYHFKDTGVFLIQGQFRNATYDFAPSVIHPKPQAPWPVLGQVQGHIELTGRGMKISQASGVIINTPDSSFTSNDISIPNWTTKDTRVLISANIQGNANALLKTVNASPIGQNILKDLLSFSKVSGNLGVDLNLELILHQIATSTVKGKIHLQDNTMSLWPFLPVLQKTKGNISFTEKGFSATQIRAQTLGGSIQGDAHLDLKKGLDVNLKGTLTSQGIFADANWGHQLLSDLKWLNGQSAYTFKATHEAGQQIMRFESNLEGMEVLLPDPMYKNAQTPYPLQITLTPVRSGANQFLPLAIKVETERQNASSGLPYFQAQYVLSRNDNRVQITQGTIGVNQSPVMPITGTTAHIQLDHLNVQSWQTFLNTIPSAPVQHNNASRLSSSNLILPLWWPQTTTANIGKLRIGERFIANDTQLVIQRKFDDWSAHITSKEIIGHLRWHANNASSPRVLNANFSRLWLPAFTTLEERKQRTDANTNIQQRIFTLLPNTQLKVDDLRFGDKQLGALHLQAAIDRSISPSRWHIQQLDIINDAATISAQGYWANTLIPTTSLTINADLKDTGQLLSQLGYEKVLSAAPGKIAGILRWEALPYEFDITSLAGNLDIELGKGEVLLADPGAGRLLSVLSLQTLRSRLSLDFRDLMKEGLAFDHLQGQLSFNKGQLDIGHIYLAGTSAEVYLNGHVNLLNETQQLQVIILPLFDAIPVSLALTTVNPPVGIGSLLAQIAFKKPIQNAAIRIYDVQGSWKTPEVTKRANNTILPQK